MDRKSQSFFADWVHWGRSIDPEAGQSLAKQAWGSLPVTSLKRREWLLAFHHIFAPVAASAARLEKISGG